ncbi:MAG: TolB family protein, partial [Fimbriimonas sp.]
MHTAQHTRNFILSLAAVGLVGCGGGGGSEGGSAPPDGPPMQDYVVGNLTVSGPRTPEPILSTGSRSTVVGMAGELNQVKVRYTSGSLNNAMLVWSTDGTSMLSMDGDGLRKTSMMSGTRFTAADFNSSGTRLYFIDNGSLKYRNTVNGAITTLVSAGAFPFSDVAVSPNGAKLAYVRMTASGQMLFTSDNTGASPVSLGVPAGRVEWLSDDRIIYLANGGALRAINADGSSDALLDGAGSTYHDIAVSWDGKAFAAAVNNGSFECIQIRNVEGNGLGTAEVFLAGGIFTAVQWAPDSQSVVALDDHGRLVSVTGDYAYRYLSLPITPPTENIALAVTPFVNERNMVGAGAPFGNACAGIIVGQQDDKLTSVVLFDAETRSTATMVAEPSGQDPSAFVYRVEANQFTRFMYSVDNTLRCVNILPTGTFNGAFVSISAKTGFVNAVLPYNEVRGGKPQMVLEGDRYVFKGQ